MPPTAASASRRRRHKTPEGHIIIKEVLYGSPTWRVDDENARLTIVFMAQGYERLPIHA